MAGKKIIYKVSAYNLLETVIAMVVIVAVSGMAMAIFLRVTQSSLSGKTLQAAALAENEMQQAAQKRSLADSAYTVNDIRIVVSAKPSPEFSGLSVLRVSTLGVRGDTLITIQKIVADE
jgi:type II secretory pathway pseudopilin PulG